jgi:hypothetical protein
MNAQIETMINSNKSIITETFNKEVYLAGRCNHQIIASEVFFNKVITEHFESMSKVMTNKCLKSQNSFFQQFYKAIDKAIYAIAKPQREINSVNFNNPKYAYSLD